MGILPGSRGYPIKARSSHLYMEPPYRDAMALIWSCWSLLLSIAPLFLFQQDSFLFWYLAQLGLLLKCLIFALSLEGLAFLCSQIFQQSVFFAEFGFLGSL